MILAGGSEAIGLWMHISILCGSWGLPDLWASFPRFIEPTWPHRIPKANIIFHITSDCLVKSLIREELKIPGYQGSLLSSVTQYITGLTYPELGVRDSSYGSRSPAAGLNSFGIRSRRKSNLSTASGPPSSSTAPIIASSILAIPSVARGSVIEESTAHSFKPWRWPIRARFELLTMSCFTLFHTGGF